MSLHSIRQTRIDKAGQLRHAGTNPYPYSFPKSHMAGAIAQNIDTLGATEEVIHVAGRLMARREHGGAAFIHLQDESGTIQAHLRRDLLGVDAYTSFLSLTDIGDIVGVSGTCFRTKTGEPTVQAHSYEILAKGLRPLPDKWHGLRDVELRYRQRYLDLIMNPTVRQTFVMRTRIINTIRRVFNSIGGLEVETPTLQPLYGGALARPFETFHNALGMPMYLRIANELYLKRLIVGGFECVYEICKDFRNEGMDRHHNPEFTMVEIYWAYRDYYDMMDLTERLFLEIARDLHDSSLISYQGRTIDLVPPWARRSMCELVSAAMELDVSRLTADEIRVLLRRVCYDELTDEDPARQQLLSRLPNLLWGEIVAELFSLKCEGDLLNPVFVTDFPKDVSPLAKVHRADSRLTERFELFISGREMANAFSELNDPVDQRERFEAEREKQAHGDREAHPLDEDFLRCMEYGMPPCGGLGIGIDRLVMLFTDQPAIQDVILFPHLRPDPLLGQADSLHE